MTRSLQTQIYTTLSRSAEIDGLRTFRYWNEVLLTFELGKRPLYNLTINKFNCRQVATNPYIVDDAEYISTATGNIVKVYSDNTIREFTERRWIKKYCLKDVVKKYLRLDTYDESNGIEVLLTDKYLSITYNLASKLTIFAPYVTQIWCKFISNQRDSGVIIYYILYGELHLITSFPEITHAFTGSGLSEEELSNLTTYYTVIANRPDKISSVEIGNSRTAIVSIDTLYMDQFNLDLISTFSDGKKFDAPIKKCRIIDTSNSESDSWYVLLTDGSLWVRGNNSSQQLGIDSELLYIDEWTKHDLYYENFEVGYVQHSFDDSTLSVFVFGIIKDTGHLYGWGASDSVTMVIEGVETDVWCYPLGIAETADISIPSLILAKRVASISTTTLKTDVVDLGTTCNWYPYAGALIKTVDGDVSICGNTYDPNNQFLGDLNVTQADIDALTFLNLQTEIRKALVPEKIEDAYIQSNDGFIYGAEPLAPLQSIYGNPKAYLKSLSGHQYFTGAYPHQLFFNRII